MRRSDRLRAAAVLTADAAQILVPILGPRLGLRSEAEVAGRHPTVITPPDAAFAVWGPIYAACTAAAVSPRVWSTEAHRRTGWWLAGAYTANAAWALLVQSGRWVSTPAVLATGVALTGMAHRRLQNVEATGAQRLVPLATGLLLGWTGVAALVNAASVGTRLGVPPTSRAAVRGGSVLLLAGAGAAAGVVAGSRHGALPVAATAGWALASVAVTTPARPARIAAVVGLVALAAALRRRSRRHRVGTGPQ